MVYAQRHRDLFRPGYSLLAASKDSKKVYCLCFTRPTKGRSFLLWVLSITGTSFLWRIYSYDPQRNGWPTSFAMRSTLTQFQRNMAGSKCCEDFFGRISFNLPESFCHSATQALCYLSSLCDLRLGVERKLIANSNFWSSQTEAITL